LSGFRQLKRGVQEGFDTPPPDWDDIAPFVAATTAVLFPATRVGRGAVAVGGWLTKKGFHYAGKYVTGLVTADPIAQYGRIKTIDTYVNRADFVYTAYRYNELRNYQSPGNSSQVLPAGSARPGGTKGRYHLEGLGLTWRQFERIEKGAFNPCVEGYVPRKVRGKWMCVPKSSKKSRSR